MLTKRTSQEFNENKTLAAFFLRKLTILGFGRGKIKNKLVALWQRYCGSCVDIKVRKIKYRLNPSDNVTDKKILCSSKKYDRTEINTLKKACQKGTFIDIGANIGYYSLNLAAGGASLVLAIEPNPIALKRLRFNIKINKFENIIKVVPYGAGDKGWASLNFTGDLGTANLLKKSADDKNTVAVKTLPLLTIIKKYQIKKIKGIKIDVEGAEDSILMPFFEKAAKNIWPTCLAVEHCNQNRWKFNIISYLLKSGYKKIKKTKSNTVLEKINS